MFNLIPRPVDLENDTEILTTFTTGRRPWSALPPYWNTGKSRIALYLTMFEGPAATHLLWQDEGGAVQAYTYLSPGQLTPIYSTPDERQWRIFLHPEWRTRERYGRLIQDAESRLNQRTSPEPLTTVAYDSDSDLRQILAEHGYSKVRDLEVYMTRDLAGPIPTPVVPDGFVIRPFAGEGEIETRAIVTNSAFGGFDGLNEWVINDMGWMIAYCRAIHALDFVAATTAGQICSSAVTSYDPITKLGEFDPVATHQKFQRMGLAKATILTGLHWLKGAGMETAVIRTDVNNHPARAAYGSVGCQVIDRLALYQK